MRCMACDAEMNLMKVDQDDTMSVPGFEWHTFMCSRCHDFERHFAFVKRSQQSDAEPPAQVNAAPSIADEHNNEPMPQVLTAPPMAPASSVQEQHAAAVPNERTAAPGLLGRVVARMRGR
jgi:hypothetical protein